MSVTDWCCQWTQDRVMWSIHALRAIPSPRYAEHLASAGIPTVFVNRARGYQSSFTWLARICCSLWYKCLWRALSLPLSVSLSVIALSLSVSLSLTLALSLSLLYREKSICGGTKMKKEKDKLWGKYRIWQTRFKGTQKERYECNGSRTQRKTLAIMILSGERHIMMLFMTFNINSNVSWNVWFVCCLYGLRCVRCVWGLYGLRNVKCVWGLYGFRKAIQLRNRFKWISAESVMTDICFGVMGRLNFISIM